MINLMVRDDLAFSELNCLHVLTITALGSVEFQGYSIGVCRSLSWSECYSLSYFFCICVDPPWYSWAIYAHLVFQEQ